jgi:hypothetical protein
MRLKYCYNYKREGRDTWDNSRYIPTTTAAPKPLLNKARCQQRQNTMHYNGTLNKIHKNGIHCSATEGDSLSS